DAGTRLSYHAFHAHEFRLSTIKTFRPAGFPRNIFELFSKRNDVRAWVLIKSRVAALVYSTGTIFGDTIFLPLAEMPPVCFQVECGNVRPMNVSTNLESSQPMLTDPLVRQ